MFKSLAARLFSRARPDADAEPSIQNPAWEAELGYARLEQRQVLSASFSLVGTLLTLDGFDASQDLTFSQADVDIGGSTVNAYIFEISSGDWTGMLDPGMELESATVLEVDASLVSSLLINGNDTISLTQSGAFSVGAMEVQQFTLTDNSLLLDIDGDLTLSEIELNDSDPLDMLETDLIVQASGTLTLNGSIANLSTDANAQISLTVTGATSDLILDNADVSTAAGDVALSAADEIRLLNGSTLSAALDGSLSLIANADDAAGDVDGIFLSDGSTLSTAAGDILVQALGDDGGDITIATLNSGGAVTVAATGEVIDGTLAELDNITGQRLDISGSAIGALDDLNMEVDQVSFNSAGTVQLADSAGGLEIDQLSSAAGGSVQVASPLTISADVNLAGSFLFAAGDSALVGDTITINNNAVIALTAATNEVLDFRAGDDILFDTGRVQTGGGGNHTVNLIADNEGALDADRGSVTNSAGGVASVSSNILTITAADGVGATGNGFRTAVDSVSITNTVANGVWLCDDDGLVVTGISNVGRDIAIATGGFLRLAGAVNAGTGDVRLLVQGDLDQAAGGIITSQELGVRQIATAIVAADDLDSNGRYDILLDEANEVAEFAAINLFDGGVLGMANSVALTIGEVTAEDICAGLSFATTTGVSTTYTGMAVAGAGDVDDADILIAVDASLTLDQVVSAGVADVRLVAGGDILDGAAGVITANELGLRQDAVALGGGDADANTRLDILLDSLHQVDQLAALNAFDSGVLALANGLELTVDTVTAQTLGNLSFLATDGLSTTYTGVAVQGAGDVDSGDILLDVGAPLHLQQVVVAGGGAADVRLVTDGLLDQTGLGIISADELGVRQETSGAIDLCLNNDVAIFSAFNNDGAVTFADLSGFAVGDVSAQTLGTVSFSATTGVLSDDLLLASGGSLTLASVIDVGASDVRLLANGDITQTAGSVILADELGIRQEGAAYLAAADSDLNGQFDILLGEANAVTELGALNLFDGGNLVYNDVDGLIVGEVTMVTACTIVFADTQGLQTTYTGAAVAGAADVDSGDILLRTGGFLSLEQAVQAGTADVRMTVQGDLFQTSGFGVAANEWGLRQESNVVVAGNDLDANTQYDIRLEGPNTVQFLAASNAQDGGLIAADNDTALTVDDVSGQALGGVAFAATSGVSTTFTGMAVSGAGDTDQGDILVSVGGFLQLNAALNAGDADVRLVAEGDVHQLAAALITAEELGVLQSGAAYVAGNDLDANLQYDVHLCSANVVQRWGAGNAFAAGEIFYDNSQRFSVADISAQSVGTLSFAGATGLQTSDGDVFLHSPGALNLEAGIDAGGGDVRLVVQGDLHQQAGAVIVAAALGIRQEGVALVAADDLDSNGRLDVLLGEANQLGRLAVLNQFDSGVIAVRETDGLEVGEVAAQVAGGKTFLATQGLATTYTGAEIAGAGDGDAGDILVQTGGHLQLVEAIAAAAGTADVRLQVDGDLHQTSTGVITANELGIRQEGAALVPANDLDSNTRYDVQLGFDNQVDFVAGNNEFAAGAFSLHNDQRLAVDLISAQTLAGLTFSALAGVTTADGNQALSANGSLHLRQSLAAGSGTVRLQTAGDLQQDPAGTIAAGRLAVRQTAAAYNAAEDLDGNLSFDIQLDDANTLGGLAAFNAFDGGVVVLENSGNLIIDSVAALGLGNLNFLQTDGVATTFTGAVVQGAGDGAGGDILIHNAGALSIEQNLNAGGGTADVRLTAEGDLHQTATGLILADELGARQESNAYAVGQDLDLNTLYDIILCFDNQVTIFAAENQFTGGNVLFFSTLGYTIGDISAQTLGNVSFTATSGVVSDGSQFFQASSGALNITSTINAANGSVYLIANGDVTQTAGSLIIAQTLGIRQEAAVYNVAEDLDINGRFDVILTEANQIEQLAVSQVFADGQVAVLQSGGDLTIVEIPATVFCNFNFAVTSGIDARGDVLLQAAGGLSLQAQVNADNGLDDVRLLAMGDISQTAAGVIRADQLGVRQTALLGDVLLCFDNLVNEAAVLNLGGGVQLHSTLGLAIGAVPAQVIGSISFDPTAGVAALGNSIILSSDGSLTLNESVSGDEVRLLAQGDVSQSATGTITATLLGVRQQSALAGDVILDDGNDIDQLAAFNQFLTGRIVFQDVDDITVAAAGQVLFCDKVFNATVGLDGAGDILVEAGGFLRLEESVSANGGLADVRLIGNGTISQAAAGVVLADELGVRQAALAGDVALCFDNQVNTLAVSNLVGNVDFNNAQDLTIGIVVAQSVGNVSFAATSGAVATAGAGARLTLRAEGELALQSAISGNAVRLMSEGDLSQTAAGTITAITGLGIRQERAAGGSIILDDGNDTPLVALFNASSDVTVFRDINALQIATVDALAFCDETFAQTIGVVTGGDILIQAGTTLDLQAAVTADAGNADVRLLAGGTVSQTAAGVITADDLGVRQQGAAGDILLCFDNQVAGWAASNPVGRITFNNAADLSVIEVANQTIGNVAFATTTGISSGIGSMTRAEGDLALLASVVAPEVRLQAEGTISQSAAGTITSGLLGIRQESVLPGDDILLGALNDVDVLAAHNAGEGGRLVFRDLDDLQTGVAAAEAFCLEVFAATTGITTTLNAAGLLGAGDTDAGDILIQTGGFLQLNQALIAGIDATDPTERGNADARLATGGPLTQAATGTLWAQELGVQVIAGSILLDQANDVGVFAAETQAAGVIAFRDLDQAAFINRGLTIDTVSSQAIAGASFAATQGVATAAGDILMQSGNAGQSGFLQIHDRISAAASDVRLIAHGDVTQVVGGTLTANELGVRQEATSVDPLADADLDGRHDIRLQVDAANDVDRVSLLNREANGALGIRDADDLVIDRVAGQAIGSIVFGLIEGIISDDGSTLVPADGIGDIEVRAGTTLTDGLNIPVLTGGNASFRGDSSIEVAQDVGDRYHIDGNASWTSPTTQVGQDGAAAGNGNVLLGSLTVNDLGGGGNADITEDDSILIAGDSSLGVLVLTSNVHITNAVNASLEVDQVQFNAANGNVFIGNRLGDQFGSGAEAVPVEIGVKAIQASIAADSAVLLHGGVPLDETLNQPHFLDPNPFGRGTQVAGTLYVTSLTANGLGFIEQTLGDLNATRIGLAADQQVHLWSVAATNVALAIEAGDSVAVANPLQGTLNALAAIDQSEVRPGLQQSISVLHRGDLVVDLIVNPDDPLLAGNVLARQSTDGVFTLAGEDGSIMLVGANRVRLLADVVATANMALPQVTIYVQNGVANDPGRIVFAGGQLSVAGVLGAESNNGTVTGPETRAFFGFDTDFNGTIDTFLVGTTEVIQLDNALTASQFIRALYGNPGEAGYRLAFVWDSQRRFDGLFASTHEIPNLYTLNATTDLERFDVQITDQDMPAVTTAIAAFDFTFQTDLIETIAPHGGSYNFDTLFAKVNPWTALALELRQNDLRVFTTVEVRNDQDINLFVGPLGLADNSLNATTAVLEASLVSNGFQLPPSVEPPEEEVVEYEPPLPPPLPQLPFVQTIEPPEPIKLERQGVLSWIAVDIDDPDNDEDQPSDYIIEVDGELILKNPDADYEALDKNAKPVKVREANRNQIAEIIREIETDDTAEAGYWYKVFIDYEDGSGKKDELLFYYFKKGDGAQLERPDTAPSQDQAPVPDPAAQVTEPPAEDLVPVRLEVFPGEPAAAAAPLPADAQAGTPGGARLGLSAGTVLLAGLAAGRAAQPAANTGDEPAPESPDAGEAPVSFRRLDRWKRRLGSAWRKSG